MFYLLTIYLVGLFLIITTIGLKAFDDLGARDAILICISYPLWLPILMLWVILTFLYAIITNKKLDEANILDIFN